jgi:hypothetical protein
MSNTNAIGLQLGSDGKKRCRRNCRFRTSDTQEDSWAGQHLIFELAL